MDRTKIKERLRQASRNKTGKNIYEIVNSKKTKIANCQNYHSDVFSELMQADSEVFGLIDDEYQKQKNTLQLIAASNVCSKPVLAALGSVMQNRTVEGFANNRSHGGAQIADKIENLAIERVKQIFGAKYANVQPHSGSQANHIVLNAVLEKNDKIMSLDCACGGHMSHGHDLSLVSKLFDVVHYKVNHQSYLLDYDKIEKKAVEYKPKLIIAGASVYPRFLDFKRFRKIADKVGAFLLADISHIFAYVATGLHPSPIDHAHFVTTSCYKAGGPRGGTILVGKDAAVRQVTVGGKTRSIAEHIQCSTFPGVQGTPCFNNIAAKAVFFKEVLSKEYKRRQQLVLENVTVLAEKMIQSGYDVLTGGTDNHMLLIDVKSVSPKITGKITQRLLADCNITVDIFELPVGTDGQSGQAIRLGTSIVSARKMGEKQMNEIAEIVAKIFGNIMLDNNGDYYVEPAVKHQAKMKVQKLCDEFIIA